MKRTTPSFFDRFIVPATSRAVLSWPVVVANAIVSVLVHLLGSPEFTNQDLPFRIFAATVAVLPMFGVVALVQMIPMQHRRIRPGVVLLSYTIAGAVRGWALSALLFEIQQSAGSGWQYRIPSSAAFMGVSLLVMTAAWGTYDNQRRTAAELLQSTRQLEEARRQLQYEMQAEALQQISQVTAEIVQDLQAIELHPAGEQVREIRRLIDEQVRPLSRQFGAEVSDWTPAESVPSNTSLRTVWQRVHPLDHLPPPWWSLVVASIPMAPVLYLFGVREAVETGLFILVALWPAMAVGNAIARRLLQQARSPRRELLVTVEFVLNGTVGVTATRVALADTSEPNLYVLPGIVGYTIFAWIVFLGRTFWADSVQQERHLREVHARLEWAIARINLMAWFHRGVISRLLHGPIQNSMHATVIRLQSSDSSAAVDGVIRELRARILEATPPSGTAEADAPDVTTRLQGIQRLWHGVADITVTPSTSALAALQTDGPAAAIVQDMCHELCSNAIRHGGAGNININLSQNADVLTVQFSDDGEPRGARSGVGLGTHFLDACSIAWNSRRVDGTNSLEIAIPCVG